MNKNYLQNKQFITSKIIRKGMGLQKPLGPLTMDVIFKAREPIVVPLCKNQYL